MLRATVIIDYQNVLLTGIDLFGERSRPWDYPLNPHLYADQLIKERNSRVPRERMVATLTRIEVYRGLPSSVHDSIDHARNLEQQRRWMLDSRVTVTHRPLKYQWADGAEQTSNTRKYLAKKEKGIDVLCALSVVRNAQSPSCELVVLASHDSDLEPALEEAVRFETTTKIESASWYEPSLKKGSIRLNPRAPFPIWNNRLGRHVFATSLDEPMPGSG